MAGSMAPQPKPLLQPSVVSSLGQAEPVTGAISTRELFEAHAAFVLRLVRRLGVDSSEAEDVTQEVFVIVHRRIHLLRAGIAVRSWLFGIARRVVANHLRKTARRRRQPQTPWAGSGLADPAEQLQRARDRARLERALSRLDADKREVFVLFELEGLDMRQVAQMVCCPLNTAYSRLYAAREIVQRYVLGPGAERSP